jgi:SAM-dependent methyltransferase
MEESVSDTSGTPNGISDDQEPSLSGWNLSAIFYAWSYGPLAHQLDTDVFTYLGDRIDGAIVADCGCGPGVVTRKFLSKGAAKILAIDVSAKMLEQVGNDPRIVPLEATFESQPLDRLRETHAQEGYDIVLFKRSLYMERSLAIELLKNAHGHLRPGGVITVVHPEKSLRRYAFGSPVRLHRHTPYHLFNRTISRTAVLLGIESYTLHTGDELIELAGEVAGPEHVEPIPTGQQAFNMVAIRKTQTGN